MVIKSPSGTVKQAVIAKIEFIVPFFLYLFHLFAVSLFLSLKFLSFFKMYFFLSFLLKKNILNFVDN